MKNTLKRAISYLLCGTMLVSALAGCGSAKPAEDAPDAAAPAESTASSITYDGTGKISEEPVTISVLASNGASLNQDIESMEWYQEILKRCNVKLDIELVDPASYQDAVKPRLAAGVDLPDLIKVPGNDKDKSMTYIDSGIFMDLTDLIDQYGYNIKRMFEETPGLRPEVTTPDGKIYYVPYVLLTQDWCRNIMVNQPWLDQLGLEQPKNMDEFHEMLKAIKGKDLNGNGKDDEIPLFMRAGMLQLFGTHWGLDLCIGYTRLDDNTVISSYTDPKYRDYLEYFNELYTEGLLYNEFATANYDTQSALFTNNQVGSILHFMSNCTGYSRLINPEWGFNVDDPIMQPILPPEGPYGDAYYYGRDPLGSIFAISKDCKHPEEVMCFMDALYQPENLDMSWYGFEGVDYNMVDGEREFTEVYLKNEEDYLTKMGYNNDCLPGAQISGSYGAKQCKQVMEANSIIREHAKNPIGFCYTLPEEKEVIETYMADLKTYTDEMLIAFVTGTTPLNDEEWDKYIANVKAMHDDDILAVYQAQVDRQFK